MRDAEQHETPTKAELEVAGAKVFSVPKTFQAQGARRTTGAGANILTTGKVSRFSFQRKKGTDHRGRELPSQHKATNDASGKDAKGCVNTGYLYDAPDTHIVNSISKSFLLQELILIFSTFRADLNALRTILHGTLAFPVGFVDLRVLPLSRPISIIFFSPVYDESTF